MVWLWHEDREEPTSSPIGWTITIWWTDYSGAAGFFVGFQHPHGQAGYSALIFSDGERKDRRHPGFEGKRICHRSSWSGKIRSVCWRSCSYAEALLQVSDRDDGKTDVYHSEFSLAGPGKPGGTGRKTFSFGFFDSQGNGMDQIFSQHVWSWNPASRRTQLLCRRQGRRHTKRSCWGSLFPISWFSSILSSWWFQHHVLSW